MSRPSRSLTPVKYYANNDDDESSVASTSDEDYSPEVEEEEEYENEIIEEEASETSEDEAPQPLAQTRYSIVANLIAAMVGVLGACLIMMPIEIWENVPKMTRAEMW